MRRVPVATIGEWGLLDSSFVQFIDRPAGIAVQLLALVVAVGIGAVHALGPGHGKALVATYLAGSESRVWDALALGGVVAAMHTGSVLVLGWGLHVTQRMPAGEQLGPALMLLSAGAVAAVGAAMLWRQRAALAGLRRRVLSPASAPATAGGEEAAGHHHHPLPEGVSPLSGAGIVALATTGGLLPSPAAFLVLTSALAMGRTGYGLALVGAFSVGMAATLGAIGVAVVSGRDLLVRGADRGSRSLRLARALPPLAAVGVLLGGLLMIGVAIARL